MKRKLKVLAAVLAIAMMFTSMPVYAAPKTDSSYTTNVVAKGWFGNLWDSFWDLLTGTKEESKDSEKVESTETVNESAASELSVIEDETTVENGEMLRAATYSLNSGVSTQAEGTILKYFPVTMYNYEAATINNATHQREVDDGLGDQWNGIYFSTGSPSAERYRYVTNGELQFEGQTYTLRSYNLSQYVNSGYYVEKNGVYYEVTKIEQVHNGWKLSYNSGSTTVNSNRVTLYRTSSSNVQITRSLPYAVWNTWSKNISNGGQYTYSGLVEPTLDSNKDIVFTKPEGGIFNSDSTVKDIYTNVEMPFVYEDGVYTFDASQNGVYFKEDSTQSSTSAQSGGRLYFDENVTQSNGVGYGDGSQTLWMPFNSTTNIDGEADCDYYFGMRTTIPFTMTENGRVNPNDDSSDPITFSFSGDDDVWVFVDGQLVIDLGGIHNRLDATIDFASNSWVIESSNGVNNNVVGDYNNKSLSGTIFNENGVQGTLNQTRETFAAAASHELTIFYLERGAGSSNCKIQFNLPMNDSVSVRKVATESKTESGDISDLTAEEQAMVNNTDFGFTLYKDDEPVANTNYNVLNENGQIIQTVSTDAAGHFYLKAGQTARFIGQIEDSTYYVVEDGVSNSYQLPTYSYNANVSGTEDQTSEQSEWTSMKVHVTGSDEAEDTLEFVCTNYLKADLPNPTSDPADDYIVVDYGLPVNIDVLENDVYKGASYTATKISKGEYGTATLSDDGRTVTYQLNKQLTGVEVLEYTAVATNEDGVEDSETAKIYIIPATSMYYEENFEGLVDFQTGKWLDIGTPQTDPQETGRVRDANDSPYGSDIAYKNDKEDSNGSSKYVSTADGSAKFTYQFTGTGTSFFARTSANSAYIQVIVTDESGGEVSNTRRNTMYKSTEGTDVGTLYNVPVYTIEGLDYGTYTVTVNLMKALPAINRGSEFYLDGIRVIEPLNPEDENYSVAQSAYSADGEANMTVVTLRQKLLGEAQINEDGTLSWADGENFVVFTDSNGEITSAEEYRSNGPKEEVYLNTGQSIRFSLANWNRDTHQIYLGVKAPLGSGTVSINGHTLQLNNAADCYYEISDYVDISGTTGTFEIVSEDGLISVTNIKVTGNAEFTIINQETTDADSDEDGDIEVVVDAQSLEENSVNDESESVQNEKTETEENETDIDHVSDAEPSASNDVSEIDNSSDMETLEDEQVLSEEQANTENETTDAQEE